MCYLTTSKSCVRSKSLSNSKFERETLMENETIHHMIINEILKLMESGKIKKPMILTKEGFVESDQTKTDEQKI